MFLGFAGAVLHTVNHATFKGLLFLGAGSVIHEAGTREIDRMGGLSRRLPRTAILFLVGAVAICGLPPLNGFVSEFFIYIGLFRTVTTTSAASLAATNLPAGTYVTNDTMPSFLFRNRGDGTFDDITESAGVGVLENTACALFADLRNSGYQDLIVVRTDGPLLFVNEGNGKFRQQPGAFQFTQPPQGTFTGAALADYDRALAAAPPLAGWPRASSQSIPSPSDPAPCQSWRDTFPGSTSSQAIAFSISFLTASASLGAFAQNSRRPSRLRAAHWRISDGSSRFSIRNAMQRSAA